MTSRIHIFTVLGFEYEKFDRAKEIFGLKGELDFDNEEEFLYLDDLYEEEIQEINSKLLKVQYQILSEMGFEVLGDRKDFNFGLKCISTKSGEEINFWKLSLELFYNPGDLCQEPAEAILGIAIAQPHSSSLIGWDYKGEADQCPLTEERWQWINRIKELIAAQFPGFEESKIVFPEVLI